MKRSALPEPPYVLGITGGIGSGKSTFARFLVEEFGVPLVEADRLGHEALLPGSSVYESVIARFGEQLVRSDGALDRAGLARIVFADTESLAALNNLVHPWIHDRILARVGALKATGYAGIILLDAALLLEWLHRYRPHGIVVVTAPLAARLDRLQARGMERADAERRIAHQRPESAWTEDADWVVENNGNLEDLANSARSVWARVCQQWQVNETGEPGADPRAGGETSR